MERSEKNFLERLGDAIPGISGYRAREDRRTTDKRLRDYLASRLETVLGRIEAAKLDMTNRGDLAALGEVGVVERRLQTATETLRFASYGYSGFFDQLKVDEGRLDQLYAHDLKIVEAVEALEKTVADPAHTTAQAGACVDALTALLEARKHLWDAP
jgi:hypothetical protein